MAAIEEVAEEVATNLEEIAEVTRRINGKSVGLVLGGVVVGAALGFYFGRKWNKEKLRAEAYEESKIEVEKIRSAYFAKDKPSVEEVIEQRGYSTAVEVEEHERPTRPPVPVQEPLPPPVKAPEPEVMSDTVARSVSGVWNYADELRNRNPEYPYVIHQDEFVEGTDGYRKVVYTYYAVDDVLVDEDDRPLPHGDQVVGQDNLKFGYGTDDEDVVFVRNQKLEIEMEICRVPRSYEEEVLGLERNDAETD